MRLEYEILDSRVMIRIVSKKIGIKFQFYEDFRNLEKWKKLLFALENNEEYKLVIIDNKFDVIIQSKNKMLLLIMKTFDSDTGEYGKIKVNIEVKDKHLEILERMVKF